MAVLRVLYTRADGEVPHATLPMAAGAWSTSLPENEAVSQRMPQAVPPAGGRSVWPELASAITFVHRPLRALDGACHLTSFRMLMPCANGASKTATCFVCSFVWFKFPCFQNKSISCKAKTLLWMKPLEASALQCRQRAGPA